MSGNAVLDKSKAFAVRVVRLYQYLYDEKREFTLSRQFLRCGTSIGANVREAQHAQSKKDFLSKMNIALKEAYECEYWLELLSETDYINEQEFDSIIADCKELNRLLTSITKTSKSTTILP